MARLYLINPSAMKLVYTNDQAVGNGCPNRRDDVLLVQFFLKVISDGPGKGDFTPAGRGPLSIDGLWGPISQAFLNQYIAVNSAENPTSPLTRDGRVDPVVNGRVSGSRSGHVYTILALNNTYKKRPGSSRITRYHHRFAVSPRVAAFDTNQESITPGMGHTHHTKADKSYYHRLIGLIPFFYPNSRARYQVAMAYWLFKEEPDHYSFDQLLSDKRATWSGVKNNTALMHLSSIKKGDRVFYYHTGKEKAVVGVMKVVKGPYADATQDDPRLVVVDVKPIRRLDRAVSLAEIKANSKFADFALVRISRLSVMPVTAWQWAEIDRLSKRSP